VWTNSPGFEPGHLRHHHGQQRVGGDVERHAEEDVGRALVELAGQPAVGDVELEQAVAGRQRHLLSTSAGFQAVTIRRRESGCAGSSTTLAIWSIVPPSGAGQERHWRP
jgi:hypothetical protein